jgi:hypothetical protein
MDVITALKQLPPRNPDGAGAKPIRTIAVDIPVAKAARDVAETYGVTIGALATFAIQRLLADLKTEQSKTVVIVREAIELAFKPISEHAT